MHTLAHYLPVLEAFETSSKTSVLTKSVVQRMPAVQMQRLPTWSKRAASVRKT